MSLTTALAHSRPDDAEAARVAARVAAWAVRRLGDSLADSTAPADIARPIELLEPLLHEIEEALLRAAEATGGASPAPSARGAAEQFGQASATTVLLRLHLEQITTRLRGFGLNFPANTADRSPRAAAAQRTAPQTVHTPRPVQPPAAVPAAPIVTAPGRTTRR
ncbi:hypothetical protein ACFVVA_12995 [Kitasatospora sp. NPDC058048]|uniref:hypothetical protein n=1 Tax=Kitasatospora sp. NPDC058048 TaxID=3346313 RepID=UPI0036DDB279